MNVTENGWIVIGDHAFCAADVMAISRQGPDACMVSMRGDSHLSIAASAEMVFAAVQEATDPAAVFARKQQAAMAMLPAVLSVAPAIMAAVQNATGMLAPPDGE